MLEDTLSKMGEEEELISIFMIGIGRPAEVWKERSPTGSP